MTRIGRYRTPFTRPSEGFSEWYLYGTYSYTNNNTALSSYATILDYVGHPAEDSIFILNKWDRSSFGLASGSHPGNGPNAYANANGALLGNMRGHIGASFCDVNSMNFPDDGVLMTKMMAESNPSRPHLNPGALLQDLFTLPKLIKELGDLIRSGKRAIGHEGVANNALAAKFGWLPLFGDLGDIIETYHVIAKRHEEINRLYSEAGLKRRLDLYSHHFESPVITQWIESGFPYGAVYVKERNHSRGRAWGTIRWRAEPNIAPDGTSAAVQLHDIRRLVLGATASGAFASTWDVIPWTWLLGWFTNVRDYVIAHGNTIPLLSYGNVCIMKSMDTKREYSDLVKPSWLSLDVGVANAKFRYRNIGVAPTVSAYLPNISDDQLSTLALLAVQRIRKR